MRRDLILCHRIAYERAVNPVDWPAIIAQLRKPLLNRGDRRIDHRRVAVYVLVIIVRLYVGVIAGIVVVRVVVVGVVWVVVPREKPSSSPHQKPSIKTKKRLWKKCEC